MLEMRALRIFSFSIISLVLLAISDLGHAQPSSAPAPTSDGTALDQGIAYVLMLVALAITYMIH
ncbi:Arabinogalactan protein [Sesbania bispinosa]|nr:Arabinogalactan protein [Sesbania bispinosa]